MPEQLPADYQLMCSGCHTPTPAESAHVIPRWRDEEHRIVTVYRCDGCWLPALAELRALIKADLPEMAASFCDFLARQGFTDTRVIRDAPPEHQQAYLLRILDALQSGTLVFHP